MKALDRKLLRDLWNIREQALAIAAVIGCGVAMFVMALSTLSSIDATRQTYYDRARFADVFARVKRAPDSLLPRITDIPGVARAETRVVYDVVLDVEGMVEPAVGRLISFPENRRPQLNDVYLRRGRFPEPNRNDEVLVSEGFANAHSLNPGDTVKAVVNGRLRELEIAGIALSPEYIFQMPSGDAFPDDKRFGVFWMSRRPLESVFNLEGAFNDISLKLMPGASEPEVIRQLDLLLEPYGGLGAYGRKDQLSNRFLSDEIEQLRSLALIAPSIFLSVAAFLLNVVLTRIIRSQREQIAAMKAFGYTNAAVGWHYLKLALLITMVGAVVGSGFGAWLGKGLTTMYTRFYRFPVLHYQMEVGVAVLAALVSAAAAAAGTIIAVRGAVKLPPAEAMRPEPPANYRPTILERLGFTAFLSQPARMILRHLERQPIKASLSILGISLAVSVLVLGNFSVDTINRVIEVQFEFAHREDVTVTFFEPSPHRAIHDLMHLPGVQEVEPFRAVPVRLRSGHMTRRSGLTGITQGAQLHRMINDRIEPVTLPDDGIAMSRSLAQRLGVREGQTIHVEVLEGQRIVADVPVRMLVTEFIGSGVYMEIGALQNLLREGRTISGGFLRVDSAKTDELYRELKRSPRAASVTVREAAIRNFKDTIAENMMRMRFFNVLFAVIIAFGVVYNSARIALAERSRELASLRVLGFTRAEISFILLGELAVLTVAALPVGLTIGYSFVWYTVQSLDSENYQFPMVVNTGTYALAVVVVLVAAAISGLIVRRKLDHLDLIAVLKTRE